MNNTLTYKGYKGSIEFSLEDKIYYGKVLDIEASISYEGYTIPELTQDFHNAIDDYLEVCRANNFKPK